MVWLDDEEIEIATASGMGMSWTPTIMMACHSYARIDDLIRVRPGASASGTDCFSMDVLEEFAVLRSTAPTSSAAASRTSSSCAFDLLRMATAGGAECPGARPAEIGTIEEGKLADLVMIDMQGRPVGAEHQLFRDAWIPRCRKSRNVAQTIVHGEVVYDNGELTRIDQRQLVEDGRRLAQRWVGSWCDVLRRTGVEKRIQPHFFDESRTGTERQRRTRSHVDMSLAAQPGLRFANRTVVVTGGRAASARPPCACSPTKGPPSPWSIAPIRRRIRVSPPGARPMCARRLTWTRRWDRSWRSSAA